MSKSVHTKLLDFQKKIGTIKKDAKNPHFKNTYASLPQILSEVKPILSEVGLVLIQGIDVDKVTTTVVCPETSTSVISSLTLPAIQDPQKMGSAITYYRRYLLAAVLSLEIDDDDANLAAGHTPQPEKPWLNKNSEQFVKVVEALTKNGNFTIDMVEGKYKLSKEVKEELLKLMKK